MQCDVVRFAQFGNPSEVLQIEKRERPVLADGEVLVRMTACPINPSDLIPIRGAYSHRISLPGIPGYEGVGVVEEVGASVSPSLLGRRVLPLRGEGTWQELVKTSVDWAVPVPDELDDEIACQLYINPMTAWVICTEALRLKPDDVLVVNACGSAIGRIFAQLAAIFGFRLLAVTRSEAHTKDLLALGAWRVIDTSKQSLREAVYEWTEGKGAEAAIDSVGGVDGLELMHCTRPGGTVLSLGLLSGQPVNWGPVSRETGVSVQLFWLRRWNQEVSKEEWRRTFERVMGFVMQDRLRLMKVQEKFDLLDVREAVVAAEAPGRQGKIVLTGSAVVRR